MSQGPVSCPGCTYSGQPHLTTCGHAENNLKSVFEDARLNVRQWPTWKLRCGGSNFDGTSSWEHLTQEDQEFSVAWNAIMLGCRDMSLSEIHVVAEYVKRFIASRPKEKGII